MNLTPAEKPPCRIHIKSGLRVPFGSNDRTRESAERAQRMLDAGLSRYEPDPMRALALIERRQRNADI